jgi:hypothetical protein
MDDVGSMEAWGDGGMRGQRSMPKPSPASLLWNIKGPTLPTTVGLEHACHVACSPCAFHIYHTFAMSVVGPIPLLTIFSTSNYYRFTSK